MKFRIQLFLTLLLPLFTWAESLSTLTMEKVQTRLEQENATLEFDLRSFLYSPRHVHISYGNDPTQMFVTWSTVDDPIGTVVEYGIGNYNLRTTGWRTRFGNINNTQFIHRVHLTQLIPGQKYLYHCGSDDLGWSDLFSFTAMKAGSSWSPRLVVFGDMGNENAQSLTRLEEEAARGMFDAVIHNGDFAYDMDTDSGFVGDAFMEEIQPIAANFPYMTSPGNHEQQGNFTQYKNRFTMPGGQKSMMYSWNMGPIHFIGFSTEVYYFLKYGLKPLVSQYNWLKNDLEEANKPENRAVRPWIITYGHRPMYCSDKQSEEDCTKRNALVRVGIPALHMFGLEDIFMKNGVDLAIWAHEHAYERLWPIYNYTVLNGTLNEPYLNPKGVTHIITGSAGCSERHSEFTIDQQPFIAFRSTDYGYTRLQAVNMTHLYVEQVSDDKNGEVIDSFTIIKDMSLRN